ncbi:tudor and KH domain-containing protein homolog [Hetaerina americana]|uniref:tudor and KH domain-containing protein homolog n=1 Tax=Hetaerina americana TaxID=62018 RepID=UPI003A7F3BDA
MVSKAALAIPIALGAAGVSLYAYLAYQQRNKKKKEDDFDEMRVKDWTEHRMVLNKAYAHLVLGQLDFIKRTSNTLITVLRIADEDNTFSIVMKGTQESVQEAESMVNRLIEASPEIVTSIMEVPKEKIKQVVGDFGNSLLKISKETGSKLLLKCDPDIYEASVLNDPDVVSKLSNDHFAVSPFYIEIQGPREKNALAYELVMQTLGNDPSAVPSPSTNRWDDFPKESPLDIINASQHSKYVEVTVSAIIHINKLYVQLHRLSSSLEKMERSIGDYLVAHSDFSGKIDKPYLGKMIAVPDKKQGKWYRAIIVGIDKKNVETNSVRAKFVDYGDLEDVKVDEIRTLPSEFSSYPYFAVECSLAGVKPKMLNADGKEVWSEEALDFFESLTSDKPNKVLMARKFGDYKIVNTTHHKKERLSKREIPALDMVDVNTSEDVDLALELISKGYACPDGTLKNPPPIKVILPAGAEEDLLEDEFDMP